MWVVVGTDVVFSWLFFLLLVFSLLLYSFVFSRSLVCIQKMRPDYHDLDKWATTPGALDGKKGLHCTWPPVSTCNLV